MNKFLVLFCLAVYSCSQSVDQECKDYYNLNLSADRFFDRFRWQVLLGGDTLKRDYKWIQDSKINKPVFCLYEREQPDGQRLPLNVVMTQQIPLFHASVKADVSVKIKAEHLREGWLKVYSLGMDEECVRKDSIRILGDIWRTYKLTIPMKEICYLQLIFSARGEPDQEHSGAKVLIDGFDVRVDGRSVNCVNEPDRTFPELDADQMVHLSFSDDSTIGQIPLFKNNPRIIGLGEMMHGCFSFGQAKNQMIRWLVENRACKLVMVEAPTMLVLKWDLYIQGYAVSLNEIIEELAGTLLVREEITELLVFLREYNDKARRKVHIAGIDRSPGIEYTLLIHDYFYEMYKQKPDSCIFRLLENYYLPDYVLPLLQNTEVTESLGDFESKWFGQLYWLKIMEDSIPGVKEHGAMNYRDYIMWRNVWYALKAAGLQEGECAVVTAHWIHLNKRNVISSFYPSLGYYLAQNYGDDYCALGMLGGEGTYCAYRFKWLQYSAVCRLTLPKEGSVEKKAMETHVPYFYYPADKLPQYPACFRYMPFLYEGNFEVALNLPQRMDGFIFIRECEGRELPAGEKALDSFAKVVAKRLERILKRNDTLNIVTKSIN